MKKLTGRRAKNQRKRKLKRQAQLRLAKRVVFRAPNRCGSASKFVLDYKNLPLLRRFISFEGKILPRRSSRLNAKKQRKMAVAIKTARVAGLLPFVRQ